MLGTLSLFVFVTIGLKLVAGLVVVYYLFAADRVCPACDGETIPLVARRGFGWFGRISGIERRWCTRCQRTALARGGRRRSMTLRLKTRRAPQRER